MTVILTQADVSPLTDDTLDALSDYYPEYRLVRQAQSVLADVSGDGLGLHRDLAQHAGG